MAALRSRSGLVSVLALLLLAGAAVVLVSIALTLREASVDVSHSIIVAVGSFVVLGAAVVPFLNAADDDLDPRRFAPYGLRGLPLAVGLALAGTWSVPTFLGLALTAVMVIVWAPLGPALAAAIVGGLLGTITLTLVNRIAVAVASRLLPPRSGRSLVIPLAVIGVLLVGPALLLLAGIQRGTGDAGAFGGIAQVVAWTPFGAAWSLPGDTAQGMIVSLVGQLLLQLVTLLVLWGVWALVVIRSTVDIRRDAPGRTGSGLGWFDVLPGNGFGAVAARSLIYWTTDRRYWVPIVAIPLIPLLMVPPLAVAGVPLNVVALIPLPFIVTLIGWQVHNDLALDSSALWLHVSSGVSSAADRWGRHVPVILLGAVVVGAGSALTTFLYGDWSVIPAVVGVSSGLFLIAVGVGSVASVRYPYPAVQPGDSPFQQPQDAGSNAVTSQAVSLLGTLLLGAPAVVLAIIGLTGGGESWYWLSFLVGLGGGLVVLLVGTSAAVFSLARRGPELMTFATRR
ncbi:hypothetical protein D9V30_05340 [Mycetocola reblochoni]|uniref:Uncharacterized protein n=2 Tax=Mycetocola reblochoni TaxID=331618 RepID=A0A3L6ZQL9_9MICO|nr:hypothetical protein D9V30_05340 [Mycetocola reblochoni]SJN28648.1 putative integral membrane transport protein [Mycetocola reblochoni REB411]